MTEFKAWPKTPRLFRDVVITEKIDGTCSCVIVTDDWEIAAQSRTRLITPDADNHGFARWVYDNQDGLKDILGPGYHYGEFWGSGIQRGYGLSKGEKRFSLFNTKHWGGVDFRLSGVPGLGVVPILYQDLFVEDEIHDALNWLRVKGSRAAPGFMNPEGVVVYHTAAGQTFKVLLENDDISKTEAKVA